jgi:hypothetical protein
MCELSINKVNNVDDVLFKLAFVVTGATNQIRQAETCHKYA